jgi:hypothetical protein
MSASEVIAVLALAMLAGHDIARAVSGGRPDQ